MAWNDLVQGARQGALTSIGQRDQRRSNSLDRLHETFGRLGAQKYATGERVATQNFTADEALKQREFEAGLAGQQHEYRGEEIEQAATLQRKTDKIVNDYQIALEKERNEYNVALQNAADDDARQRLQIEHDNRLAQLAQDNENSVAKQLTDYENLYQNFPDGMEVPIKDPTTGQEYKARNPAEVEAYLRMVMENAAAAARDDPDAGKGMSGAVFDAEFQKLMASRPDLWPMGGSWYIDVDEETFGGIRDSFHRALLSAAEDGYITSDMIPDLMTRFNDYVKGPQPDAGGGGAEAPDLGLIRQLIDMLINKDSQYQPPTFNITWPDNMVPGFTQGDVPVDLQRDNPGELRNPIVEPGGENSPVPRTQAEEDTASTIIQGLIQTLTGRQKRDAQGWMSALDKPGLMEDADWIGLTEWLQQIQSQLGAN